MVPRAARKWIFRLALLALLLGAGAVAASVALLDTAWAKSAVAAKVKEATGAEMKLGAVDFRPWQGALALKEVRLSSSGPGDSWDLSAAAVDVKVKLLPLVLRKVEFAHIVVASPDFTLRARPEPETSGGDLAGVLRTILGGRVRQAPAPPPAPPPPPVKADVLEIRDGAFHYIEERPDGPHRIDLTGIRYRAEEVGLDSLNRLLAGASLEADFPGAAGAGRLSKRTENGRTRLDVEGLGLDMVTRHLGVSRDLPLAGEVAITGAWGQDEDAALDVTLKRIRAGAFPGRRRELDSLGAALLALQGGAAAERTLRITIPRDRLGTDLRGAARVFAEGAVRGVVGR